MNAAAILERAAAHIRERAALRDKPAGERSMRATVEAFNAIHGTALTEVQGWQFLEILKMARSAGGKNHPDDFEDAAAYAALAGEAASRATPRQDPE